MYLYVEIDILIIHKLMVGHMKQHHFSGQGTEHGIGVFGQLADFPQCDTSSWVPSAIGVPVVPFLHTAP